MNAPNGAVTPSCHPAPDPKAEELPGVYELTKVEVIEPRVVPKDFVPKDKGLLAK